MGEIYYLTLDGIVHWTRVVLPPHQINYGFSGSALNSESSKIDVDVNKKISLENRTSSERKMSINNNRFSIIRKITGLKRGHTQNTGRFWVDV